MVKVLIVDDDRIIRNGLISIISKSKIECEIVGSAQNGKKALEMITNLNPDIVITDIKMPIMDGIELIKCLKNTSLNPRIIVLSGFDDYKYVRETMKDGAVDYLLKPISSEELVTIVNKIIIDIETYKNEKEKKENDNLKIFEGVKALKEKFLKTLINEKEIDFNFCKEKLKDFNLENTEAFLFGTISIDDSYRFFPRDNKLNISLLLSKIKKELEVILEADNNLSMILTEEKNNILIILFIKNYIEGNTENQVYNKLTLFKNTIKQNYSITVTLGLSNFYTNIIKTPDAYEESILCIERRFYEGKDRLIIFKKVFNEYSLIDNVFIENHIEKIINYVDVCSVNNVRLSIEELFNYFDSIKQKHQDIRRIINDIILKLCNFVDDFQFVLEKLIKNQEEDYYSIENIDVFDGLKVYLINTLCEIVERVKLVRDEKGCNIIEIAKNYIKNHYFEEINLKIVAQQVYLSANYFSELFRNETGKNFIDYLMETRINMAKGFLKKPGVKVYEVAEMVGYKEVVSFNRAFKKVVGVSPKEYIKIVN